MRSLGEHAFEQRKATIIAVLDSLGDLEVEDAGKAGSRRHLGFRAEAPGSGLSTEALFRYEEWFRRDGAGAWALAKYQYDYVDLGRGARLAYHRHAIGPLSDVIHAHCEAPDRPPAADHFRAYELDLLEAHEEFVRLYAAEEPIDCRGLRPLAVE